MIHQKWIGIGIVGVMMLLTGCSGDKAQMLQQLEQLEQRNRSGEAMLNDSLAESLVNYFDRHGDANERMRSRYILGRTYYCLDELPRALETYMEAADCADTTSADCDFAKLSRVYAQTAAIYYDQIQPHSQLEYLCKADYFAQKGKDELMSIECLSNKIYAYELLKMPDSVISISESVAQRFKSIGRCDRACQILAGEISILLDRGETEKSRLLICEYEKESGLFDKYHNISSGHEIYYYTKGLLYTATNHLDSAELMFRKELRDGKDLNNQIAGCKGLQKVFEQYKISDSIAKYATLSYELNDSAYSLSEMQNIQKMEASYNYNHIKYMAEKKRLEAERAWLVAALISLLFLIIGVYYGKKYLGLRKLALDHRLRIAGITLHLKELANSNPPQYPMLDDWDKLRALVEREIPSFRKTLRVDELSLTDMDYDMCLMIRVHLLPIEIAKLKQCSPSTITKSRRKLLRLIFDKDGNADDFDDEIGKIGN
jgi:hypothetical protein